MWQSIISKHVNSVKGIIQVGANTGQEMHIFKQFTNNIVLVEPIKELAEYLKHSYPNTIVIPYALGSKNEFRTAYHASNNNESTSFLTPVKHPIIHPQISFYTGGKFEIKTWDMVENEFNIKTENYNVLVTDTQGFDLEVIKGFNSKISNFDLIISEYIDIEYYENNCSLSELELYLKDQGFQLVDIFDNNGESGNAVFSKKIK